MLSLLIFVKLWLQLCVPFWMESKVSIYLMKYIFQSVFCVFIRQSFPGNLFYLVESMSSFKVLWIVKMYNCNALSSTTVYWRYQFSSEFQPNRLLDFIRNHFIKTDWNTFSHIRKCMSLWPEHQIIFMTDWCISVTDGCL